MLNDPSSRARARMMREALVDAKVGLSQSRAARDATSAQLARERTELATVLRRGQLAAGINDAETVRLAAEYERKHTERIAVLERKLAALEQEVALVERETAEMSAQLKRLTGAGDTAAPSAPDLQSEDSPEANDLSELDSLRRSADRTAREADAESRLADLKRRMGK
jgi:DNA repair exonuclease SbcCD nuclease subunit